MAESLLLNKMQADITQGVIVRKIQIGDVGEIADRKSTFSYTITLPKTSKNIALFEMLGVIGNTSRKPYEEIVADYIVDGVYIIVNGLAVIKKSL